MLLTNSNAITETNTNGSFSPRLIESKLLIRVSLVRLVVILLTLLLLAAACLQFLFPFTRLQLTGSCQFCDLDDSDLAGLNLQGADLRYASLRNADLRGTDFTAAHLIAADLSQVNAIAANFTNSDLTRSRLTNGDFRTANFSQAVLTEVQMDTVRLSSALLISSQMQRVNGAAADLRAANLNKAILSEASLIGSDLRGANLSKTILNGATLSNANLIKADFAGAQLDGTVFRHADLRGSNFDHAVFKDSDLSGADFRSATMTAVDLSGADLRQTRLTASDLSQATLVRANLQGVDLTRVKWLGANLNNALLLDADLRGTSMERINLASIDLKSIALREVDLRSADLIDLNLQGVDFSGAYLYGTNLRNLDLQQANFTRSKLTGADFSGADLTNARLGSITSSSELPPNLMQSVINRDNAFRAPQITSFWLQDSQQLLSSKSGLLYRVTNNFAEVVIDLNEDPLFTDKAAETGLMGVASHHNRIYLSYTQTGDAENKIYLVVNEYDVTFKFIRTILRIGFPEDHHHAGTIIVTPNNELYLSTGDGAPIGSPAFVAQDLESLRGKILRLDLSDTGLAPEIIAYGLRNPWKFSIDEQQRMFIADVGHGTMEALYMLTDLHPDQPYNMGWPVFEGSKRMLDHPLQTKATLAPIFEYTQNGGRSIIGGYFLEDLGVYLLGDFLGSIRLLRETESNRWEEIYHQQMSNQILSFGYQPKTKMLFMAGWNETYTVHIEPHLVPLLPTATFCNTTMPDGSVNN
ncbi:MAG: pentapeptide repeat-containing protein, partial [Pseudomonadota bacterium]|nr:pentapeptide repeat-containing protein [Pseudomonadota bacterium]